MSDATLLQARVDSFFRALGVQEHGVKVEIVSGKSLPAVARGVNLWNYPFGQILIHTNLTAFSKDELDFILAHELMHIFYNHLPISVLASLPQSMIDALVKVNSDALWLKLVIDFLKLLPLFSGSLPPEVSLTKDQEIQADVFSICLTGNRTAALEALKKLVDSRLDEASHKWEAFGVELPVMTMKQRLAEIQRITSEYEKLGYKFR
jgi:Zn-dependent protease with chaperone function